MRTIGTGTCQYGMSTCGRANAEWNYELDNWTTTSTAKWTGSEEFDHRCHTAAREYVLHLYFLHVISPIRIAKTLILVMDLSMAWFVPIV